MKAVVIDRFGGNEVVDVREVPRPSRKADEVLVRVFAASINPVDWKVRTGSARIFTGSRFPMILGNECAGKVEEAGHKGRIREGDRVIAVSGIRRLGTYAEYVSVPEKTVFPIPAGVSFAVAATIPIAGLTSLQALRDKGRIAQGMKVLVNGASGGVGHYAVQIAKIFGTDVTAVCSGVNKDFVRGLGADQVVDYTQEDFTKGPEKYDIIFDAVSSRTFSQCRKALAADGTYIRTLPSASVILNQYVTGHVSNRRARLIVFSANAEDMNWMFEQIEAKKIRVAIDHTFSLDQTRSAFAQSETGRTRGKIVLSILSEQLV